MERNPIGHAARARTVRPSRFRRSAETACRTAAHFNVGIVVAQQVGMALFWETTRVEKPTAQPQPLSPLAVALLLKLRAESEK
jgi:hypothetical protein